MTTVRVLCCRPDRDAADADPAVRGALARCGSREVDFVGHRPGKEIDLLLTDRIVVLGDDADLAAVVLRLLRRELLGSVIVGFATDRTVNGTFSYTGGSGFAVAFALPPCLMTASAW